MSYSLEPASAVRIELQRKIIAAGADKENQYFFFDGAFSSDITLENALNTWIHENFVVISDRDIIAYFEATWTGPVDIISGFRLILFDKKKSIIMVKAFLKYIDYLFILRGHKTQIIIHGTAD
jgi:hypothetical protein